MRPWGAFGMILSEAATGRRMNIEEPWLISTDSCIVNDHAMLLNNPAANVMGCFGNALHNILRSSSVVGQFDRQVCSLNRE